MKKSSLTPPPSAATVSLLCSAHHRTSQMRGLRSSCLPALFPIFSRLPSVSSHHCSSEPALDKGSGDLFSPNLIIISLSSYFPMSQQHLIRSNVPSPSLNFFLLLASMIDRSVYIMLHLVNSCYICLLGEGMGSFYGTLRRI